MKIELVKGEGSLGGCDISLDGNLLAVGGVDRPAVEIFDAKSGSSRAQLPVTTTLTTQVCFTPDELLYADANEVHRVTLDTLGSPRSRKFTDLRRVSLSPSGRYLTLCGERLEVWDGGKSVWKLEASSIPRPLDVRLSPDGEAVLLLRDEHLVLHRLATGEEHRVGAAEGPSTGEMALSADGRLVAYCDEPVRELRVTTVASGEQVADQPDVAGYARSAFSGDGKILVVTRRKGEVSGYRLSTGEEFFADEERVGIPKGLAVDRHGSLVLHVAGDSARLFRF